MARENLTMYQNKIVNEKNKIINIQEIKDIENKKIKLNQNIKKIEEITNKILVLKNKNTTNETATNIKKEIKNLKTIQIEYETSKKILKEHMSENKFLLEHKFNPKCVECANNKKIHEEINYIGKKTRLEEFINLNADIVELIKTSESKLSDIEQIDKLEQDKKTIENENNNINMLIKMDSNNQIHLINNKQIGVKIEEFENTYNTYKKEYDTKLSIYKILKNDIEVKKKLEDEIDKLEDIKKKYDMNKEQIIQLKEHAKNKDVNLLKKNQIEKEIKKLEKDKIILENEFKINSEFEKELDKKELVKNNYERVLKLFTVDKLLDNKILSIINNLEGIINNILKDLTDFSLKFVMDVNSMEIFKIKDDEIIDARGLSGYEMFASNLAIRIAFCKLNKYTRSNFLIIDEGFTASSQNNLSKMDSLFDIIRKYFKWSLVVSHLDQIKTNYDVMYSIQRVQCGKTFDSHIFI